MNMNLSVNKLFVNVQPESNGCQVESDVDPRWTSFLLVGD